MKTKRIILIGAVLLLLVVAGIVGWNKWASPTRIALVNFPTFQASNIALSNTDEFIKYADVPLEEVDKLSKFDFVLVWAMGIKLTEEQRAKLIEISKEVPTHSFNVTSAENKISSLDSLHLKDVSEYLANSNKQNYQSLSRYIRQTIDNKKLFVTPPDKPIESKKDVLFHIDENVDFADVSSYEKYLKEKGFYKEGAPKVAIISGIHSPFAGNKEYIDDVIQGFQNKGFNVYPILSFEKRLAFLQSISPDAVIYFPHGRISMAGGDAVVAYLKEQNVPVFAPISVIKLEEDWLKDKMGMFGGFMGQTIVMPELDGAIYPYVLIAQEKTGDGIYRFKTLPNRLTNFTQIVENFIRLKSLPANEKKVAIYYFKGMGSNALTAQGLEAGASLYNLLKQMKAEGYKVENLPNSLKEFELLLDKRGCILPNNADGAFQKFIDEGNPILVEMNQYEQWLKKALSKENYDAVINRYGEPSGGYMSIQKDKKDYLAIAQIDFGNVVILPQPAVALGKDDFTMAHGAKEPPTHAYLGSYLWTQNGFKADALIHFGTHGSLEFTEGKQVALSGDDWGDILVGSIPHFYYYTIANIGESVMAKRRSYATTVSYLTPPFTETDMRHKFRKLQDYIHSYFRAPESQKKEASILVKRVAVEMGLHRDLRLDSSLIKPYSEEEIEKIDNFAEEIATEKINGTLYITGEKYSSEHITSTVLAMSADPIAYSLAALDKQRGKVSDQELKRQVFFTKKYLDPAKDLVKRILSGEEVTDKLVASVAGISVEEIEKSKNILMPPMPMFSMGGRGNANAMPSSMANMSASKSDNNPMAKKSSSSEADNNPMAKKSSSSEADNNPMAKKSSSSEADNSPMAKKSSSSEADNSPIAKKSSSSEADNSPIAKKSSSSEADNNPMAKKSSSSSVGMSSDDKKDTKKEESTEQSAKKGGKPSYSKEEKNRARAILEIDKTIRNVVKYQTALANSPQMEYQSIFNAMRGGYVLPSSGGDPIANPRSVPTGHNLFSINAEMTPSEMAWDRGVALANNTINTYLKKHGEYPKKVAYTFWSSEFIETEGVSIAQALYMLGVEPVRDSFGRITDVRLIPSSELKRPRIDIVIQTSGQFRDLAASRLFLITRAIELASAAADESYDNLVNKGSQDIEAMLVSRGVSPKEARELSTQRIFGGIGGGYSTGTKELMLSSNKWENQDQIAEVYLNNMGATYGLEKEWGEHRAALFEASLQNTDILIQPRQNNTWGALSLDHVFEFMGGMNTAIKKVTGKDPDAYLADYRNHNRMRMQELKEAIGVESRATIFNPKYIKDVVKGGKSSAAGITELVTNAFGWEATRPEVIDAEFWNQVHELYVLDKENLGVKPFFERENPAAMQEITAIMLETVRKGFWKASPEQIKSLTDLHLDLVERFGLEPSGFAGENDKLQDFIERSVPKEQAATYRNKIQQVKAAKGSDNVKDSKVLRKEESSGQKEKVNLNGLWIGVGVVAVFVALVIVLRRKRRR